MFNSPQQQKNQRTQNRKRDQPHHNARPVTEPIGVFFEQPISHTNNIPPVAIVSTDYDIM
jgi:hypothetical protein